MSTKVDPLACFYAGLARMLRLPNSSCCMDLWSWLTTNSCVDLRLLQRHRWSVTRRLDLAPSQWRPLLLVCKCLRHVCGLGFCPQFLSQICFLALGCGFRFSFWESANEPRMSLIQDLFSDTTEEQQEAMLNRLLSTSTRKSSLLKTEILHDVLTLLSGRGWRCKAIFRSQGKSGWCLAIWPCDFKGWQGAKCCRGFYTCGSERLETSRSKNLLVLAGVSIRIWRLLSQTRGRHRKSAGKQETSRGSSENPLHHFKEVWRCPQQQRVTARRVGTRCQISVGSAQKAGPRYFGMNYHTSSPQGLQVATNG